MSSADGNEEKKTAPTPGKSQKSNSSKMSPPLPPRDVDSDDDDIELVGSGKFSEANPMYNSVPGGEKAPSEKTNRKDKDKKKEKHQDDNKKNKKGGWFSCFAKEEKKDDDNDDDGKPLLDDDAAAKQREMDDEEKEAAETASWLKSLAGIPGNDPADSKWLKLMLDHNTGVREPRGQLCVNVQIWPKDKAIVMPVGARRDDPNTNPYLPPPVGRLKWSWNPFVLGSQLCGPWICAQVFCCLLSITFVVLMIFCQPFLTLMINIIFFLVK